MTNATLRIFSLAYFSSVLTMMFMIPYVITRTPLLLSLMISSALLTTALLHVAIDLAKKSETAEETKDEIHKAEDNKETENENTR